MPQRHLAAQAGSGLLPIGGLTPLVLRHTVEYQIIMASSPTMQGLRGEHRPFRMPRISDDFVAFIEFAPDAMIVIDEEGLVEVANSEAESLFGYRRDELLGQPVEMLLPERFRSAHRHHRREFAQEPRVRPMGAGLELRGLRRDGSEVPMEISLSPLQTDGGMLVAAAIRDVTEQRRVALELRSANERLEAANEAKDRFLASMSHELRTPLNAILGFTGTLLMQLPGPLNEEQVKQLTIVESSGKHLLSLINDLLDLAKIESGKLELELGEVPCAEILEEVAAGLRPLAETRGVALAAAQPEANAVVRTDRRALMQILVNLTHNAIKFTGEGWVRLSYRREQGDGADLHRFVVRDTGIGISEQGKAALFQEFARLGDSAHPTDGAGLGLHISQRLANLLRGRITFESEPGEGSTFVLELPA